MTYTVKDIFYTLQGEGGQAGRAAVFCRFTGCNLWTGREEDRSKAVCQFCDTDFIGTDGPGGGKFASAHALAEAVRQQWPAGTGGEPLVVCTGGEPLLQLDQAAVDALHAVGFEIAVETNGTQVPPGLPALLSATHGRPAGQTEHQSHGGLLHGASAVALEHPDAQGGWDCVNWSAGDMKGLTP